MTKVPAINTKKFSYVARKVRNFFLEEKGFVQVYPQCRLSILAACEDPKTIAQLSYAGQTWPLPQTGQMWLEYELFRDPNVAGYYCESTSYRNEPNPVPGRHDLVFPLHEFETHGGMETLVELESDLLEYLGFIKPENAEYPRGKYLDVARKYGTHELEHEHEHQLYKDHGAAFFLTDFPIYTSPFWNMKKDGDTSKKVDVILCGMETIGSAERSCDPQEMSNLFHNISGGEYASILYSKFTKERVEAELAEFLKNDFTQRCGGGIGMTRLVRAMDICGLIPADL